MPLELIDIVEKYATTYVDPDRHRNHVLVRVRGTHPDGNYMGPEYFDNALLNLSHCNVLQWAEKRGFEIFAHTYCNSPMGREDTSLCYYSIQYIDDVDEIDAFEQYGGETSSYALLNDIANAVWKYARQAQQRKKRWLKEHKNATQAELDKIIPRHIEAALDYFEHTCEGSETTDSEAEDENNMEEEEENEGDEEKSEEEEEDEEEDDEPAAKRHLSRLLERMDAALLANNNVSNAEAVIAGREYLQFFTADGTGDLSVLFEDGSFDALGVRYNLACAEARLGHMDTAMKELLHLEQDGSWTDWNHASVDEDLTKLHVRADFRELLQRH